jgi:hypothetical protein
LTRLTDGAVSSESGHIVLAAAAFSSKGQRSRRSADTTSRGGAAASGDPKLVMVCFVRAYAARHQPVR